MQTVLRIEQMDCPTEEQLIRDKLGRMPGIAALEFNLMQRRLYLTHAPEALSPAIAAIQSLGMEAKLVTEDAADVAENLPAEKVRWWPLAFSGTAATAAEVVHWFDGGNHTIEIVLALLAILVGGLPTYKKGWIAVRNLNLNINALMSIAVTGAALIGEWPEAAMVMFLFALAELIEAKSLDRARNAIRGLMALAPERATVQQADGSWTEVEAKTVPLDTVVRVRPGERIALDGVVVSGATTVNQAPITGESLPVEKTTGDPVYAGTINEAGSCEYRVTATADNSTLSRIIHAVEEAQGARAPTQRFVDQFARVYTPVVCAIALAMALIPPLAFGTPWFDAIYSALVLLVIACPCALVISTPVTIVSGLAAAARHGILIKGGVYLEQGGGLSVLALDKTGTITHGKPVQTEFERIAGEDDGIVRRLAASLAARSDHPVSQAIARTASEDGVATDEVADFAAIPGRGVRGRIAGILYQLGNHQLVEDLGRCSVELEVKLSALERQGKTVVMLIDETQVLALFAVADTVKESSRAAIADLHALKVKTVMLTGDNVHTAEAIAAQVGIDEARGNLLPTDKLDVIKSLLGPAGKVGMAGDGINDAPALAGADIGFAMGAAGTGTAIETADVALMDDDLRKIPLFIRLSRKTTAVLKQNITLALAIKAVFIVLVFMGNATLWMAVFADMGASLLVVANGLRLLRFAGK
jgi:Cd2+/Zn2+-exporting ATPase